MTELSDKCLELRKIVLEMCIKAGTGHVTSCFSCVEIMVELFYHRMKPEDVFILSKGQASPLLYAILADKGIIPTEWLWEFAKPGAKLGVHLDHHIPGAVITAGSLGHGLGIAAGIAKARKIDNKPGTIYCLLGDGECYEGSIWESAIFIGNENLDNLMVIVDRNGLMVTGDANVGSLEEKFKAFNVPCFKIEYTTKGKGIPFMENKSLWHGVAPQEEDAERAIKCLN